MYTTSATMASGAPFHTVLEREVEDIRCSLVQLEADAPRHAILHDRLSFWVPLNGRRLVYDRRARQYECRGGDSITMTAGGNVWEGAWHGEESQACVLLEIGDSILHEHSRKGLVHPNGGHMILRQDERIRYSMLALYQDLLQPSPASGIFTGHIARGIAQHYVSHYCRAADAVESDGPGLSAGEMRRVREHVQERLSQKLSLPELAGITRLSVPSFCRRFRASTGLSPYQYVLQAKVERAKALLERQEMPLTDLALSLGFYDQSQFTNTFRRITGVSPRDFRRRNAA
ncbi:MAG TPA: AraC family transcriptional regulator [Solimonas sp.]